jgi:tRNA(fMet)-specific endonuclease VapC
MDEREDAAVYIPVIVKAEMLFGREKNGKKAENRVACENFLNSRSIVNLDDEALECYARIRADLERQGSIIGPNDLFIADFQ